MDTETQPFQLFGRGATYWVRFSIEDQGKQRFSLGTKDAALAQQKYQRSVWSADPDAFGRLRTAYRFCQTYAMNQILEGVDVYTLAITIRTSARMI
ncbi:hypothetical protein DMC47_00750 [Nostoc sp. 3335mG]|nr:hypothetical protein DMC47_00750 [Nostoc sp. 3335mG]